MKATRTILNLLLTLAFAATFYVTASTHTAAKLPTGTAADLNVTESLKPTNVPVWADVAAEFPTCAALDGNLHETVVVVTQHGDAVRMGFDAAWAAGQDKAWSNDVWTVGGC